MNLFLLYMFLKQMSIYWQGFVCAKTDVNNLFLFRDGRQLFEYLEKNHGVSILRMVLFECVNNNNMVSHI